jgi:hypothetical protein
MQLMLKKFMSQEQDPTIHPILKELLTSLERKYADVGSVLPLAFATILDPRFKTLPFIRSTECEEVVNLLINQTTRILNSNDSTKLTEPSIASASTNIHPKRSLWESFDARVSKKSKP